MLIGRNEIFRVKDMAGEDLDVADRIRIRRDIGFAARAAADAVSLLFEGAHTLIGQQCFGLDPKGQF
jgi:3-hydroxy-9,10-secoandrosta-1,3,5(10)-triene-9,17-dione monooxygenase